jgi:hypothetical protein
MPTSFDRLILENINQETLLELNNGYSNDTYIRINNYLIGSYNCNFVISKNNENLLTISSSNIILNKPININNVSVNSNITLYDAVINNSLKINSSNVNINNDIIITSNILEFNKKAYFNSNIYTNTLYVNNIDNTTGSNIIINNLELNRSIFNNPQLLNTVNINRNTSDNSNIISFFINNNSNLKNILNVANTISINKYGEINIKDNIKIASNSIYLSELSIDEKNHLTIGKTKNTFNVIDYKTKTAWDNSNFSLLHLHRNDNKKEYDIIKDPLLYITADYNQNCNIIRNNYEKTDLIFSNLVLTLDNNISTEEYLVYLNILPDITKTNIKWYSNIIDTLIESDQDDDPLKRKNIIIYFKNYDYNSYKVFTNGMTSTSNITSKENYNIDTYVGFYKTTSIENIMRTIMDNDKDTNQIGYNIRAEVNKYSNTIDYHEIIKQNYNVFEDSCNVLLNFNIHILYEKSAKVEEMYYIDLTPVYKECPSIISCLYNTNSILNLNSNGLLVINNLHTLNANIPDVIISNIHNNVSFMNCNIRNVNNLNINSINVQTINALSIETETINILGGQKISFSVIDTSNFDSTFFKYNNARTNFFNEFTLCEKPINYNFIDQYRKTNNIHEFLISSINKLSNINTVNSNIAYIDGNLTLIGELKFKNGFNINNVTNKLIIKESNVELLNIGNNVVSLGNYFNTLVNTNKIWLGDYSRLLNLNERESILNFSFNESSIYNLATTDNFSIYTRYKNYFNQLFYNNIGSSVIDNNIIKTYADSYNINIFGNVRIATKENHTILELADNQDMNVIPKHTMNVYGNIKCCKPFSITDNIIAFTSDIALDAMGNANIHGNINSSNIYCSNINNIGYIYSTKYIKTDEYIEAKLGVRNISDSRVKYDLKKIENAVDKIKLLSGYTFKRNDLNGMQDTGLLAQDVKSILPEVVNENKDGLLNIEYAKMMGLIVEAIKELSDKIDLIS